MIINNKQYEYEIRRLRDLQHRIEDEIKELERKIYIKKEEVLALNKGIGRLDEIKK